MEFASKSLPSRLRESAHEDTSRFTFRASAEHQSSSPGVYQAVVDPVAGGPSVEGRRLVLDTHIGHSCKFCKLRPRESSPNHMSQQERT